VAEDIEQPTQPEPAEAAEPRDDDGEVEPATLGELLDYIARELVDEPDSVEVTETPDDRGVLLTLRVAPDDMGKVIGRGGRTARAIRTVVKAAAIRAGIRHTHVDIAD
jgi:predicted RNA-binding protein YlqC (UPF0109 family)